jgi:hypothetical protein
MPSDALCILLSVKATNSSTERDPSTLSAKELAEELASLAAHIDAARCRWLELLAEFDRRGEWGNWIGATSCADWLAWRCAVGTGEAREFVRVAGRLRELALLHDAFARGELSYTKVRLLSKVADEDTQEKLLDLASRVTTGQLQRLLRSYQRVSKDDALLAQEQEFLDYEWDEDCSLIVRGRLPAEDGALLLQALEAARESLWQRRKREPEPAPAPEPATTEAGEAEQEPAKPKRPWRARPNVEAFVAMAESALADPDRERSSGDRYQVVVHVDAGVLADDRDDTDERCELDRGVAVAPETARRVACDASVVRITERDDKAALGRPQDADDPAGASPRVAGARPGLPLPRLLELPLRRRPPRPALGQRRRDQAGQPAPPLSPASPPPARGRLHRRAGKRERLALPRSAGAEVPPAPRPPPGSAGRLREHNGARGLTITADTTRNGSGERLNPGTGMDCFLHCLGR